MASVEIESLIKNDLQYLPAIKDDLLFSYYGMPEQSETTTDGSEMSYPSRFTSSMENSFIFLPFNIYWLFAVTMAVLAQFYLLSYKMFYSSTVFSHTFVLVLYIICMLFNLTDIFASTLHYVFKKIRDLNIYRREHVVVVVFDGITVALVPLHIYLFNKPRDYIMHGIALVTIMYRLRRFLDFISLITASPFRQSLPYVLLKYGTAMIFVVHTASCAWMYVGECNDCENDEMGHWTNTLDKNKTSLFKYWESVFYMFNGITTTGIGGASSRNDGEAVVYILMMLFSLFVMNGVFLGTFTAVQLDKHFSKSVFGTQLNLIFKILSHKRISSQLRNQIKSWYFNFWIQESAVQGSSIQKDLPVSIQKTIVVDKYWFAIMQSLLLRQTHMGFKRALAHNMSTEYFNVGDIILQQDDFAADLIFVAKGVIQVVAPDDIKSPILTLGYGTCLGDSGLMISYKNPATVLAASYCKLYILKKEKLWFLIRKYKMLNQSKIIHEVFQNMLIKAKVERKRKVRAHLLSKKRADKSLKAIKPVLPIKLQEDASPAFSKQICDPSQKYIIKQTEAFRGNMDKIFVRTTWPWVLYPKTQLLLIWETIIVIASLCIIICYPIVLFYLQTLPLPYVYYFRPIAYFLFIVDLIFQLFTAYEDEEQNVVSDLSALASKKFTQISFLVDVLSVVPFEIVFRRMVTSRAGSWYEFNHMLKMFRVLQYREKITEGFSGKTSVLRILLYVISLVYVAYLQGILYYKLACPVRPCELDSWMVVYKKELNPELNLDDEANMDIIWVMLMYGMLILTGTGGKFFIQTTTERVLILSYILFCIFLYTYILADYSATLSLLKSAKVDFLEIASTTRKYMLANKIDRSIVNRCNRSLETQWSRFGGTQNTRQLMSDVPLIFYERFSNEMYADSLLTIPILKMFDKKNMLAISGKVISETYPPDEVVMYAGCKSDEMYIIEQGYCLLKSPGSEKMIGPKQSFSVLDMLLEVPVLYNVRTLTNVSVLKITREDFKAVLSSSELWNDILATIQFYKNSAAVQRLFVRSDVRTDEHKLSTEYSGSFFSFPTNKLAPLNLDYQKGWSGFNLVKYMLRRSTILPAGKFLYIYEIFHSIVAFISCIINASLFIYETILPPYAIIIITVPIDFLLLLDIYIRMHVCYYNKKGILVTHPRLTATNYYTNSFAVDLISALPFKLIANLFNRNTPAINWLNLIKLLRAYRIPNAFEYCNRDVLKGDTIILCAAKFLLLSIVILNALASVIILLGCRIVEQNDQLIRLVPHNMSWVYTKQASEIEIERHHPSGFKIYLLACYYITCLSMQLGLGDVSPIQSMEIVYSICVILSGFLWFTYILIILSNTRAVLNINITRYQYHMKDLRIFMKRHHIPNTIQNKCISHFEYIWQRTQGTNRQEILMNFHTTVKADTILAMYHSTFSIVDLFKSADLTFYNTIGTHLKESYYLSHNVIMRVNNIVDSIYIVHSGEVHILGPADNTLVVLKKGSVFGNLDNIKYTRSMVTAISTSAVDLLEIPTAQFYSLTAKYPSIERRLQDVIHKNLPYVVALTAANASPHGDSMEFLTSDELKHKRTSLNKMEKFLMTRHSEALFMTISFMSYMVLIYHVAFHIPNNILLMVSYSFDLLHIIKVYIHFYIPYINRSGEIVTSRKLIKKRYVRQQGLYIDLVALIPFELLTLVLAKNEYFYRYFSYLRLNRVVRFVNIKNFFSVTDDYLNVNVMVIKLCGNCIYFAMLLHTVTCIWYMLACPLTICSEASWTWTSVDRMDCVNTYVCAMYYSASILTFTGYDIMIPRSYIDVYACIFMCLFNKFFISFFISDMAAIVRHYGFRLGKFGQKVKVMKTHLNNGHISFKLQERMHNYIDKLWYSLSGRQMPLFLEIAPQSLAEEIKDIAFGYHITGHIIFCDCHMDLLRLMIHKTELVTFFNGDLICKQGDIDNCMYFIHAGIVHVILESEKDDTVVDMLETGDSFGMLQGLFPNTPHSHSFLCKSVTEVVSLKLNDWGHYLQFYPASKYLLYTIVSDYKYLIAQELAK